MKLVGLNCKEAKKKLQEAFEKVKDAKFPTTWEDIHHLVFGKKNLIIKDLEQ